MANQPAANLCGFLTQLDAQAKKQFLAACHAYGISGNEAVQRFVAEVIAECVHVSWRISP